MKIQVACLGRADLQNKWVSVLLHKPLFQVLTHEETLYPESH